ncbi:MAG: hypothetical protein KJ025_11665, partial [Burkholderiales bacterium]|nr:hypothetical protein [Burkholderiales bacterium]
MHTIAEQFSTRFGARRFVRERHALVVSFAASMIAHAALIGVARWPELDRGLDALPVLTATLRHPAPVAPAAEPAREPAAAPAPPPAAEREPMPEADTRAAAVRAPARTERAAAPAPPRPAAAPA